MLNFKEANCIDDNFDIEDIILINYYKMINESNAPNTYLLNNDEYFEHYTCLVFNGREVFESVLSEGKRIFNLIMKDFGISNTSTNNLSLDDYVIDAMTNLEFKNTLMKEYDNWIKENGYPYLNTFERSYGNSFIYFVKDSLMLYIFYEIHKWIWKINNNINKGHHHKRNDSYDTHPTYVFEFLTSLIKSELVNSLIDNNNFLMNLDKELTSKDVANLLERNQFIYEDKINYFNWVRMGLISYISNKFYNFKDNFNITKQLPIYNAHTNQYRIYYSATSLMGIAYNFLLLNLTADKFGYQRKICKNPECTNEFEKVGNTRYCDKCIENNIPNKIKNARYEKYSRKKKEIN